MILLKSQEKCIMELAFIEKKANLSSVEIYEQNNLSLKKNTVSWEQKHLPKCV